MIAPSILRSIAWVGVRTRLSALVFLAIVPLLALLVVGAGEDRQLTLANARTRALDLARLGAERQVDVFVQAQSLLRVLDTLTHAASLDWRNCDQLMADIVAQHPQFASLGVVAASGATLCHSVKGHPTRFGDLELLAHTTANPRTEPVVGRLRFSPALGKPTVMLARPFFRNVSQRAPPEGIVFVSLDLGWMQRVADDLAGDEKRAVVVADARDGTVIVASPDDPAARPNRTVAGYPLGRMMGAGIAPGSFEAKGLSGEPRIFGIARLPGFDAFAVAVGLSRATILAEADTRFSIGILLALVATTVAIGAAWWLAHVSQLRPIRDLVKTAKRLGAGDLTARARLARWHAPEFRALANTLGAMADGIAQARHRQSESDQELRLIADHVNDMIVRIDRLGRRLYVSPACRNLLGYEPAEMLAIRAAAAVHPDDQAALAIILAPSSGGGQSATCRYRMRRKDGTYTWVEGSSRAMPAQDGRDPENIVVVRGIEHQVEADLRLKESEVRYRILAEHSTDMVFQLDRNMVRRFVSPACRELVGREPQDMVGVTPMSMAHAEDGALLEDTFQRLLSGELERASRVSRIRHRDGRWIWVEAEMRAVVDPRTGRPTGIIGALRDISVRKRAEDRLAAANRQLETLATQDALTGLLNRRGFDQALQAEFGRALRENAYLGLIMIDVDRFKAFNDLYGHQAGDECLRAIGKAIERSVRRPHDIAARYGGEELAVLLPHTDTAGTFQMADRIRQAIRALRISHVGGSDSQVVTVSAGVACLVPQTAVADPADLLRAADIALYEAKRSGRDTVREASDGWELGSAPSSAA